MEKSKSFATFPMTIFIVGTRSLSDKSQCCAEVVHRFRMLVAEFACELEGRIATEEEAGGEIFVLGKEVLLLMMLEKELALSEEVFDFLVGSTLVGLGFRVCLGGKGVGWEDTLFGKVEQLDVFGFDVKGLHGKQGTDGNDDSAVFVTFLVCEDAFDPIERTSHDTNSVA